MFSNILVAVDGSESSKRAFEKSLYLSQKCDCKLHVIHVVACDLGGDSAITFDLLDEIKAKAASMLEDYKNEAGKNGISINVMMHQGDPAQIIIELSKKNEYDLIIMGTRGRTAFQELLLGSVSLKVMHHASCPVMVVQ
jgi:nucleotide-binding universal stress UspA family protein